jgi:predicted DNA-binding protein with PD1-like motif
LKVNNALKAGELFFVRIEPDEDLLRCLEEVVTSKGYENAVIVTAIGALKEAVLINPGSLTKPPEIGRKELEGPFEIVSLTGALGKNHAHGGKKGHIHICLSRHDGPAVGGSLDYGNLAFYPIDVCLLAYQGPLGP